MEANKADAEDCIRTAKRAAADGNLEKAIRFLEKSIKLYPTDLAKNLQDVYRQKLESKEDEPEEDEQQETPPPTGGRNRSSATNGHTNDSFQSEKAKSSSTAPESSTYSQDQLDAVRKIKNSKDFYEILGVPKTATEADLKKAYRKMALLFHPDKNKAPGATEAFKTIGKAFAILNDTSKRRQYDQLGPESFDSSNTSSEMRRHDHTRNRHSHRGSNGYNAQYYWNDEDFSADELFNLFFGVNPQNRARHATYVYTTDNRNSNNSHVLFQLMPILLIVFLTLISNFLTGEPIYSMHKTDRYNNKRITSDHHVPYFVKNDFKIATSNELNRLERQVEEDLLIELRTNCYREKSYKESAVWRARNYGDERLLKKAYEYETPSCTRIKEVFGIG